jgi:matrix metalloproteinase-14 (membrane-inserted)
MSPSDVDREIARAFQMWADVTDLAFVHIKNPSADVDIDILYVFKEIISHCMAFI